MQRRRILCQVKEELGIRQNSRHCNMLSEKRNQRAIYPEIWSSRIRKATEDKGEPAQTDAC